MAEYNVDIALKAIDKASQVLKKVKAEAGGLGDASDKSKGKLAGMGVSLGAVGAAATAAATAIAATAAVTLKAVTTFAKYELSATRLNAALERSGQTSAEARKAFQGYVQELSLSSNATVEQISNYLALATSMGATGAQARDLVRGSLDLAAAIGTDQEQAVRQVMRTLGGYAGELSEVIPEVKDLTKEQLRNGEVVDILTQKFGGAAADEVDTLAGAYNNATTETDRLFAATGELISQQTDLQGNLEKSTGLISKYADHIQDLADKASDKSLFNDFTKGTDPTFFLPTNEKRDPNDPKFGPTSKEINQQSLQYQSLLKQLKEVERLQSFSPKQIQEIIEKTRELGLTGDAAYAHISKAIYDRNQEIRVIDQTIAKIEEKKQAITDAHNKRMKQIEDEYKKRKELQKFEEETDRLGDKYGLLTPEPTLSPSDPSAPELDPEQAVPFPGLTADQISAGMDEGHKLALEKEAAFQEELFQLRSQWGLVTNEELAALQLEELETRYEAAIAHAHALGQETTQIEKDYADAREQIERQVALTKATANLQAASQIVGAAQSVFSDNKPLQIALATINTLTAITNALASVPFPGNIAAAASMAAQGYAQVKKIKGTNIQKKAFGGLVVPDLAGGSTIQDRVPALLTPGETVVSRAENQRRLSGQESSDSSAPTFNFFGADQEDARDFARDYSNRRGLTLGYDQGGL